MTEDGLLGIMRNCGVFKCTECLYALWQDRGYGKEFKCCHPRTVPNSAWNDLDAAMFGSACDVFEPMPSATAQVAERMSETSRAVRQLIEYAWAHTHRTPMLDSIDEKRLLNIIKEIDEQGMVRT